MDDGADLRLGKGDRTLAIAGAVAGAVPFMIHSTETSSVTVNGQVTDFHYRDNVAVAGGGLAAILGVFALILAIRNRGGAMRIAAAAGVLALGGFQLARGLGVFASAGDGADNMSSISITQNKLPEPPTPPAPNEKTCATADACDKLVGELFKDHPDRAAVAAARSCELGSGHMCSALGVTLVQGEGGIAKDPARALKMFGRACELKDAEGCKNLGVALRDGLGADKPDPDRSLQAMARSCELGLAIACNDVGVTYDHGNGVKKDPKRAVEMFTTACKGKEPLACSNLALCYQTADGVKKDLVQAYALYTEACDLGRLEDCNDAAVMIGKTKGVPKDGKLKRELYQKACDGKVEIACKNLKGLTKKH